MASQGLASTCGSASTGRAPGLQLAREAVVQAVEALRACASLRSRSVNSRHTAIDSARQPAGCGCWLNQPMKRVSAMRGMRLVSRKFRSSCCSSASQQPASQFHRACQSTLRYITGLHSLDSPMNETLALSALALAALAVALAAGQAPPGAVAGQAPVADRPLAHGQARGRAGCRAMPTTKQRFFALRRRAGRRWWRSAAPASAAWPRHCRAALRRSRWRSPPQAREGMSDLQFTGGYRVPFQYSPLPAPAPEGRQLRAVASSGVTLHRPGRQRLLRPDRLLRRQRVRHTTSTRPASPKAARACADARPGARQLPPGGGSTTSSG